MGILFGCGQKEEPVVSPDPVDVVTPEPDDKTDEPDEPETPTDDDKHINGTELIDGMNAVGLVKDASTGKGIPGVPVTDGYHFTTTDENGVYQMELNDLARLVYITVPAAYKIPLDERHAPAFYSTGKLDLKAVNRNDFTLEMLSEPENEFTLVMIGDPQCQTSKGVKYFSQEFKTYPGTIPDIKATINEGLASGEYKNVYAMTLGDIVFDSNGTWDPMRDAMSNVEISSGWLPFFQCIGNHDHDATVDTDYKAVQQFMDRFGPTDYSFDRGNAHIVVMDNVVALQTASASYPNGKTWGFGAGYWPEQWEWLKQDLDLVKDKENKIMIFCSHIPFRNSANYMIGANVVPQPEWHKDDILNEMAKFNSAELMIGHSHYSACYIHKDFVCKSGRPVMEHIHQAACGGWWNCNSSVTGAPNGYTIYNIKDGNVVNWTNEGTGRSKDYQFRVYDGNQIFTGALNIDLNWYTTGTFGSGAIPAFGNELMKGSFVAEVWDDDDTWWTVEMYQNGVKIGDFTRVADGTTSNMALAAYAFNVLKKNSVSWTDATQSHYWYFKPASEKPSEEKNWEVVVTHTIPGSGLKRVFRRNDLTTDYSEF